MTYLHASFRARVMPFIALATLYTAVASQAATNSSKDIHGGVPMGISNQVCDNGQEKIEIDWNPNSTVEYTCTDDIQQNFQDEFGKHYKHCDETALVPLHICYPQVINYDEDLPTSGRHRPLWPKYGEYVYLPVQRWLHSLEHGAVAFLYHPCADPMQIEELKGVARSCLYRHVISPYKKFPPGMYFALLTWKCKLILSGVDVPLMVDFIKNHALQGPEHLSRDGQYKVGLIQHASFVSDEEDSHLCPSMSMLGPMAEEFKDRSAARRIKSQKSQHDLDQFMKNFLHEF